MTKYLLLFLLVAALGCTPLAGHVALGAAFVVAGRATRTQDVTPSWKLDRPELPYHRHIETREVESMLQHVWGSK